MSEPDLGLTVRVPGSREETRRLARADALALLVDIERARRAGPVARAFVSDGSVRAIEVLDDALRALLGLRRCAR